MRYSNSKEISVLVDEAVMKYGVIFFSGSKHGRLKHPDIGKILTIPKSPSCYRAFKNFKNDLKRYLSKLDIPE
jgi:hypothetical protein